jgi:hypothetical protein
MHAASLAKLLSAYGGIIGFDSFRYSILGHINLLIGTRQGRFLKESIILRLNGIDYHIHIGKLDPLYIRWLIPLKSFFVFDKNENSLMFK